MILLKLTKCKSGNCGNSDYGKLMDEINAKLYKYSKLEYNNMRLFLNKKLNCDDQDAFDKLVYYKDILVRKLACDLCLSDYSIDTIVSKIKKLLR